MKSFLVTTPDNEEEKSRTENGQVKRLEKNEKEENEPVITTPDCVATENGQNLCTLMPLNTGPKTKTGSCYLLTKSNNPVTTENFKEILKSGGTLTSDSRMSIIKLASSKDNHVYICCFETKQSSAVKNDPQESQTSLRSAPCSNTSRSINQSNSVPIKFSQSNSVPKTFSSNQRDITYHTTNDQQSVTGNLSTTDMKTDNDLPTINGSAPSPTNTESDIDQGILSNNIHHECKASQIEHQNKTRLVDDQIVLNTTQESVFRPVSKYGSVAKSCFKTDPVLINDHHQSENSQTPLTHNKLPFRHHFTNSANENVPENCYLDHTGSWDPLGHHIEYHEKSMTLPRDLRSLKESELLPMAYDDFTKCLEDADLCCTPPRMMSPDDDGVVPSSSPLLSGNKERCYLHCSDASTNGSQEYPWDCFSPRNENIYQSPPLDHANYPQYGTLNWGLTPTIIYKTPEPDTSLADVGDECIKCSINAGSVQLLTPPPPNYKKLLRRSRRRMERRRVKRRRIYFGDDENCQGLQEVPVNEGGKGGEQSLDTNFVPDDPMWFEDEFDEKEFIDGNDKSFSRVSEDDFTDWYESLPNSEGSTGTYILNEAVEDIMNLEEALDVVNTDKDENEEIFKKEELNKPFELKSCEDVLEMLPQWNEIDEPSDEIQEILSSVAREGSLDDCKEPVSTELQDKTPDVKPTKKKRNTSRKRKVTKKRNKFQCDGSNDTENSNSQRDDGDSVFDDSIRSNSSSRSSSRGSRSVTPIYPKPSPGVLVSPPLAGFIPLQTIGKPLILPKPDHQDNCFSPPPIHPPLVHPPLAHSPPGHSPLEHSLLTSPQLLSRFRVMASSIPVPEPAMLPQFFPDISRCMTQSQWLRSVVKVPARVWQGEEKNKSVEKGSQKKTIPNGYMLYCKERRNSLVKEKPELKPGEITKLLSENWNKLSEQKRKPYVEEAMKLRHDENEWINQTP